MLLNSVIATAILASSALAAPQFSRRNGNPTKLVNTTSSAPPASTTAAAGGLSLAVQLFLADTAVDRFALLPNGSDFVFDFVAEGAATKGKVGKGGDLVAANRKTFPALVGTGAGIGCRFPRPLQFQHPSLPSRLVELQIITEGTLVTEMLPENGVFNNNLAANGRRVITNTLTANQMTPFYQGSIHTQFNPDCVPATFVAAFTSEDFGAGQVADELISFSSDVVIAAFGQAIDGPDVDNFKKSIPTSIALGVEQCLQKCGIAKR
jgi:hypothetical protein